MNDDLMRPFPFSVNLSSLRRGRLVKTAKPYLWETMTFGFFAGVLLIEKKLYQAKTQERMSDIVVTKIHMTLINITEVTIPIGNVCVLVPPVRNHCGVTRGNTAFVQTD